MTKRYKLKKDLPTFKAGDIFTLHADSGLWKDIGEAKPILAYAKATLDKFPAILKDWFEEIPEKPKTVWDLKTGDTCWVIVAGTDLISGSQITWNDSWNNDRRMGNILLTKTEAEKEIAWRQARAILKRDTKGFKPDWENESQSKWDVSYCRALQTNLIIDQREQIVSNDLVFGSPEDARDSIAKHPKEWKIYLGVE